MDELTHARLVTSLAVLVFVAIWVGVHLRDRRRQARFAALAQSFGKEVVREGESLSRFHAYIDGRTFDVRLQHIGPGPFRKGAGTWYVMTEVALKGLSDMHSTDLRARWGLPKAVDPQDAELGKNFTVHDAGSPLSEDRLNNRVRTAIAHFYALDLPLDPLNIEEGRLIHRSCLPVKRFSSEILRELLTRQRAVATALEAL